MHDGSLHSDRVEKVDTIPRSPSSCPLIETLGGGGGFYPAEKGREKKKIFDNLFARARVCKGDQRVIISLSRVLSGIKLQFPGEQQPHDLRVLISACNNRTWIQRRYTGIVMEFTFTMQRSRDEIVL